MADEIVSTMNRIADVMNAVVREWKDSGAVRFDCLPVGSKFVFVTYDDTTPKVKTSHRLYRRADVPKSRCFTTGSRVLVREVK